MQTTESGFSLPLALKIFLSSVLLVALSIGAAVFVTNWRGGRIADEAVERALATSTAVQKEFEERNLESLQFMVQLIAADASFVRYIAEATGVTLGLGESASPDIVSIGDLLKDLSEQYEFKLGIVLDHEGNVLARTDETEAFEQSMAEDPLVQPALENLTPYSGYWRLNNQLYQAAIIPLQQDEDLVGFVLVALAVDDKLSKKVAKVSGAQIAFWLPAGGELILAASSFDTGEADALREVLAGRSDELMPAVKSGKAIDRLPLQIKGEDWVANLTPTAAEGEGELGAVLSLTSSSKIAAGYRDILNLVLLAGLGSMAFALLLSYLLSKRILRPVTAMAKAAEQAAAGNYQTHIGISGNDELARMSHAFDSLLSDLREKSDIQGYVNNLSKFLPDPGQEESRSPSQSVSLPPPAAPRSETVTLLGLDFRQFARKEISFDAESALAEYAALAEGVGNVAKALDGEISAQAGGRFLLGFSGEDRTLRATQALAALRNRPDELGPPPAAALVEGDAVHGTAQWSGQRSTAFLGAPASLIDRLLGEAGAGQTLLARNVGESLKTSLGATACSVATGAATGKHFYALESNALNSLPALPAAAVDSGSTIMVTPGKPSYPPTPVDGRKGRDVLDAGTVFGGRFEVLSVLGQGGMGVVYKARDIELDDIVALKMLKPGALLDAEQLDRLKSELKLARKITHPNVLRTFDFGDVNGIPFISMEYVRGMTLRFLLHEAGRLPLAAGLRIAKQLGAGLAAAHEVGVLHRDIKPENLILETNGNAKLMDFGISRPIRRSTPGHTQPGTFLGTPNYSAPEQLAGDDMDHRADIYSSGVLMCEMFCGKLPFTGNNTMEIYLAQMQQAPIKPSEYWPDIPPPLEAIILKCLQKRPEERYNSAAELTAELGKLRA